MQDSNEAQNFNDTVKAYLMGLQSRIMQAVEALADLNLLKNHW
jgi:hypothetical protein